MVRAWSPLPHGRDRIGHSFLLYPARLWACGHSSTFCPCFLRSFALLCRRLSSSSLCHRLLSLAIERRLPLSISLTVVHPRSPIVNLALVCSISRRGGWRARGRLTLMRWGDGVVVGRGMGRGGVVLCFVSLPPFLVFLPPFVLHYISDILTNPFLPFCARAT